MLITFCNQSINSAAKRLTHLSTFDQLYFFLFRFAFLRLFDCCILSPLSLSKMNRSSFRSAADPHPHVGESRESLRGHGEWHGRGNIDLNVRDEAFRTGFVRRLLAVTPPPYQKLFGIALVLTTAVALYKTISPSESSENTQRDSNAPQQQLQQQQQICIDPSVFCLHYCAFLCMYPCLVAVALSAVRLYVQTNHFSFCSFLHVLN